MSAADLVGRSALVTGAGSGIGRAIARAFALAGAYVTCADINPSGAEAVADEVRSAGGKADAAVLDIADRAAVDEVVDRNARDRRLDILCCSAAIINDVQPSTVTDERVVPVMQVNFMGTLYSNQAAVRHMRSHGRGSIINLASACLDMPSPGQLPYSASKAAVVELTRYLALEVAQEGIRVNVIAPGYIDTPIMSRHYLTESGEVDTERRQAMLERFSSFAPMGRIGEPEEVASVALFLASDMSSYMTGQTLRPNGGMAMPR